MERALPPSTRARVSVAVPAHSSRRRTIAAMAGLLSICATTLGAQAGPPPSGEALNSLRGNVRGADESRLVGVHVDLLVADGHATVARGETLTGEDGTFRFDHLPDGAAQLVVRRLGFRPETLTVEVPQLPGGPLAVALERAAQPLAPVFVREVRRAPALASPFERRRAAGFGHYITRADIEHQNPQRTSELLRRIPGVNVGGDGAGNVQFRASPMGAGRCEPAYFLDGSPLGSGALDLDAVSPSSIEAIEVYNGAATVPAALRSAMAPGGCGAIAIWSRRADRARHTRAQVATVAPDSLYGIVAHGIAFTADQVEFAALPLPGFSPRPVYPDSLRDANVRGQVVAEFVVDERGRVAPETVGIVSSTHPLFADAVRDAIAGSRFSPAFRDKHVVRQVVHLPVVFEPEAATRPPITVVPMSAVHPD